MQLLPRYSYPRTTPPMTHPAKSPGIISSTVLLHLCWKLDIGTISLWFWETGQWDCRNVVVIMEIYVAPKLSRYMAALGAYNIKSFTYEINPASLPQPWNYRSWILDNWLSFCQNINISVSALCTPVQQRANAQSTHIHYSLPGKWTEAENPVTWSWIKPNKMYTSPYNIVNISCVLFTKWLVTLREN